MITYVVFDKSPTNSYIYIYIYTTLREYQTFYYMFCDITRPYRINKINVLNLLNLVQNIWHVDIK